MTIVNLHFVTGIICPQSLKLTGNCRHEVRYQPPLRPEIWTSVSSYPVESLKRYLQISVDPLPPNFWRTRMVSWLGITERFHSVELIPYDVKSEQTLLVIKDNEGPPFKGFFAPYLSQDQGERWVYGDKTCNEEELGNPANETEPEFWEAFLGIMNDFLKDTLSQTAILTYVGSDGKVTARGWIKG